MKSTLRTLIATALVLGVAAGTATLPAAAGTPAATVPAASAQAPHPALEAAIAGLPTDRATAALVRVGGTEGVWRGAAGVHDLKSNRPVDPAARFRAGSVTKVFTAAVALQLASEGRLDLDRSARSYLPDLIPGRYGRVTVRQLLNHTHGIPAADFAGDTVEEWYANRFEIHDPREMVR
ncbi:beta-lactamase family protein [Streptomyces sp. ISL-36]|nr:beta-lactamase family protein [Streptomyces sp. ISL-36]